MLKHPQSADIVVANSNLGVLHAQVLSRVPDFYSKIELFQEFGDQTVVDLHLNPGGLSGDKLSLLSDIRASLGQLVLGYGLELRDAPVIGLTNRKMGIVAPRFGFITEEIPARVLPRILVERIAPSAPTDEKLIAGMQTLGALAQKLSD